jgi:hypothetical protein
MEIRNHQKEYKDPRELEDHCREKNNGIQGFANGGVWCKEKWIKEVQLGKTWVEVNRPS